MLMRSNVALCVIGCVSGRVELDGSDPEHLCGTRMTSKMGELQAMCCAVLWMAEQLQIDDAMRMDIRLDSKYAGRHSVARRTLGQCTTSDVIGIGWNGSVVGGVGITNVRSHKGRPSNEMADSLAEVAVDG